MLEESKLLLSDRFSAASQTLLARNMEATQNEASGWGVPPANKSPATQKIPHAHVSKTIPAPSGKQHLLVWEMHPMFKPGQCSIF